MKKGLIPRCPLPAHKLDRLDLKQMKLRSQGCLLLKRDMAADSPTESARLSRMKRRFRAWVKRDVQQSLGVVFVDKLRYLKTAVQRKFFHDVMHVTFHCVGGDVELMGNFLVAQAISYQRYDLARVSSSELHWAFSLSSA